MIHILVRFMQIGCARESWQICHKGRLMDLPALTCMSNLHEPHQNMNHSLNISLIICFWVSKQLDFVLPEANAITCIDILCSTLGHIKVT